MTFSPRFAKFGLVVHLTSSVGWLGSVAAYVALDVTVATSRDAQTLRAAYIGMGLVASHVIVPLSLAALVTGIIQSLGTKWGLFRHYWVLISLVLTTFATVILLSEMRTISHFAALAADPATSGEDLLGLGSTLVHSFGGMVLLLVIMVLNVYKPRGMTRYGWRRQQAQSAMSKA